MCRCGTVLGTVSVWWHDDTVEVGRWGVCWTYREEKVITSRISVLRLTFRVSLIQNRLKPLERFCIKYEGGKELDVLRRIL